MINDKFLSHRLRGFYLKEHSFKALTLAIQSNIPYLEVDTRVSSDGIIYIHHDNLIKGSCDVLSITKNTSFVISEYLDRNNIDILKLDDLLDIFTTRQYQSQVLMIDIKDYGYESEHINLVKKHNLLENIVWISWIPQTLLELDKLSPNTAKILSYIPINKIFAFMASCISIIKIPFLPIIIIGQNHYNTNLKNKSTGYQHAYISYNLNDKLIKILSKNGGGVCVSKELITNKQLNYNTSNNLITAIFSAKNREEYTKFFKTSVDIIFCDFIDKKVYT